MHYHTDKEEKTVTLSVHRLARAICRRCRGCGSSDIKRKHPRNCDGVRNIINEARHEEHQQQ
jgi:hypothetical protein